MGVKAGVDVAFEWIHRSKLVGIGVLPLQFREVESAATLGIDGTETCDLIGLEGGRVTPRQEVTLRINKAAGKSEETKVILRIDTPIEVEYYRGGGILPYVLRQLIAG